MLITFDKDFGELVFVRKLNHSGVMRLVNLSLKQHSAVCQHILNTYKSDLEEGAFITVDAGYVRIRKSN